MCTQAAWPGRFLGRGGNLELDFLCVKMHSFSMCRPYRVSIQLCVSFTSFGLEIGDAVHDDMVKEQRLVVDLNLPRKQAAEVLHIPEKRKGKFDCSTFRNIILKRFFYS